MLLDQTMPEDRRRHIQYGNSSAERPADEDPEPGYSAGYLGESAGVVSDYTNQTDGLDLWSFWDSTQDLTTDLGSQLKLFSTMGSAMWSWGTDEQPQIPSPSLMSGVLHSNYVE